MSEQTFGCILDWAPVRNTHQTRGFPAAGRGTFRDNVPDTEYPVGTILQLVPFEAMVKHPREKFPKTNGWEFFALDISPLRAKVRDHGDSHSTGTSTGAPLFLIRNTRSFAGLVLLALRPTT